MLVLALLAACGAPKPAHDGSTAPNDHAVAAAISEGDPDAMLETMRAEATVHYTAQEYPQFVATMEKVVAGRPEAWVDRYNLACGYALSGRPDDALRELQALADAGVDYGMAADPDLASLRERPEFAAMLAKLDALYPAIHTSTEVTSIDDPLLLPEGITWDAAGGRYLVGSMARGTVSAVTPDGKVTPFGAIRIPLGAGSLSAIGVHVDAKHGAVWVVGTMTRQYEGFSPDLAGVTGVFQLDLATGAQGGRFLLPTADPTYRFNDLAVASDGTAWITGGPALYRLIPGEAAPSKVLDLPPTNGITFGPDARTLYVGALDGLVRVDTATLAVTELLTPEGEDLGRFDGMEYVDGSLVAVQYGQRWRVVQVDLTPDGNGVAAVHTLERGTPGISEATTGVMIGDRWHWISGRRLSEDLAATLDPGLRGVATQPVIWSTPLVGASADGG